MRNSQIARQPPTRKRQKGVPESGFQSPWYVDELPAITVSSDRRCRAMSRGILAGTFELVCGNCPSDPVLELNRKSRYVSVTPVSSPSPCFFNLVSRTSRPRPGLACPVCFQSQHIAFHSPKLDAYAKSLGINIFVIPAKAGIQ